MHVKLCQISVQYLGLAKTFCTEKLSFFRSVIPLEATTWPVVLVLFCKIEKYPDFLCGDCLWLRSVYYFRSYLMGR